MILIKLLLFPATVVAGYMCLRDTDFGSDFTSWLAINVYFRDKRR